MAESSQEEIAPTYKILRAHLEDQLTGVALSMTLMRSHDHEEGFYLEGKREAYTDALSVLIALSPKASESYEASS